MRRKSPRSTSAVGTVNAAVQRHVVVVGDLHAAEEEQLVAHDRPAERAAELVPLEPVIAAQPAVLDPLEERLGVELVMAGELEQAAMERVGARLGDRVDRGAGGHAVAGIAHAGLDSELLQRVRERNRVAAVLLRVVVVAAVNQVQRAGARPAADRDRHRAGRLAVVRPADLHGAARQQNELRGAPAVERQADELLFVA